MLLSLAVLARLPLIHVETDDPLNIRKVLQEYTGEKVHPFPKKSIAPGKNVYDPLSMKPNHVYTMMRASETINFESMHESCAEKNVCVILVNPKHDQPTFFKAGFVSCPTSLIQKFVDEQFKDSDEDTRAAFVAAFSGLSYKVIVDLTLMAQAASGGVASVRTIRKLRAQYFGNVRGLQQENTEYSFYQPDAALAQWLDLNGPLFLHSKHATMVPRGLLFDGPPGTGKTMGAKHMANTLNVPLYRLDIGSAMGKYVGESEHGLQRALAQADQCAPCVLLIDEVEKLFQHANDGGTTTRLLSQLLWWLQEHRSRVLTVMTTNNRDKLPPELIRPGRIDSICEFPHMAESEATQFVVALAEKNLHIAKVDPEALAQAVQKLYANGDTYSAAYLTQLVLTQVKQAHVATLQ